MKEQKEKEAARRSAVSGKKIKLKVKKSSKDKEVNYFFFSASTSVLWHLPLNPTSLISTSRAFGWR